ncbi:MAG: GGDEF domain-containing protein [Sterolibacterium sp.]|jgi:diguanylate cyclase (GGDEF)-like protein
MNHALAHVPEIEPPFRPANTLGTSPRSAPFIHRPTVRFSGLPANRDSLLEQLHEILDQRLLTPLFQPIVDMRKGVIMGYEGLIRGPSDSPLHSPISLFKAASSYDLTVKVEHLCRRVVLEQFLHLGLSGKLFLNVSPECLLQRDVKHGETLGYIRELGISPDRVIIELTENQPTYDYDLLREAVSHYRSMGFEIAIDDLGEGFSSLRLWSELRPEYVKVDMHFIQGINQDPVKQQFVRSIQEIAKNAGTSVIAEGIETIAELLVIKDLEIACAQGYYIARPHGQPAAALSAEVVKSLGPGNSPGGDGASGPAPERSAGAGECAPRRLRAVTAAKLLRYAPPVTTDTPNCKVFEMFNRAPDLQSIAVVSDDLPLGIINRYAAIERFAHPYWRDLHGRKSCIYLMDSEPVVVEMGITVQELSRIMVEADRRQMANGFILTDQGKYQGVGTSHDLMAEITKLQIDAAKYANPLTQLPGNVPISEHIDQLLEIQAKFSACYCDLDHFKPYNDVYGYHKGDDVIQLLGRILTASCDPDLDFVGHIGGDDFMILFRSDDVEARCQSILERFAQAIVEFSSSEDQQRGGYFTEDRQGNKTFCPLISLSLGLVVADPGAYASHHQVSVAVAGAKKQAKKIAGNSLFVERRSQRVRLPEA